MSWSESYWITRNIVKSIQRGSTTGATTVTIQEVNVNKAFVLSASKGSAGYVAARGNVTGNLTGTYMSQNNKNMDNEPRNSQSNTITLSGARTISGGSTDLTTKQYSAQLISATQLQCDGACEWQVVEFY